MAAIRALVNPLPASIFSSRIERSLSLQAFQLKITTNSGHVSQKPEKRKICPASSSPAFNSPSNKKIDIYMKKYSFSKRPLVWARFFAGCFSILGRNL
jgi:hypothetical protein